MASDTVWGEIVGRCWVQSLKKPLYSRKQLTKGIPDAKQGPGPRGRLHHQVNIHEDADQWEERQSRDLWAESVHHWTQFRCLKGRPYPTWVGDSCPPQALHSVLTETVYAKPRVWIREESIGFSNSPHSLYRKGYFAIKGHRLHSPKVDTLDIWAHLLWMEEETGPGAASRWWPWPQWWAAAAAQPLLWARGLQRTPGWATGPGSHSGWSAGELQGSRWRRTGWTQKIKTSGRWVTPISKLPTSGRAIISPRFLLNCPKHTALPILSNLEYSQEKSHCSPSRKAHP